MPFFEFQKILAYQFATSNCFYFLLLIITKFNMFIYTSVCSSAILMPQFKYTCNWNTGYILVSVFFFLKKFLCYGLLLLSSESSIRVEHADPNVLGFEIGF